VHFEAISDPLVEVDALRRQAEEAGLVLPEAMTLATVDSDGNPQARVVLLKGRSGRTLDFYTNYQSAKARELKAHPRAALCIHYPSLAVQVRILGAVERTTDFESDAYFATRPRESQIGAWASRQSEVLFSRDELDQAFSVQEARFFDKPVPRPPHWGGLRMTADVVELWLGRSGRLHDRARYTYRAERWSVERLYP
jgi:pyridoxamine 5'-phosphate oxidase